MRKILLALLPLVLFAFAGEVKGQSPLCFSKGNNQYYEWVTRIKIANGEFTSGKTGYADFTATPIATLTAGQTYNIEVDVRTNNTAWHEYVKIWFDLNQDNQIQDPEELIYNQNRTVHTFTTFTGTITIPTTAYSGVMIARMIMQYAAQPALCGSYTYGTTYDIKANIVGGVTNPVNRTITVNTGGSGSGHITSTPAGINTAIGVSSFDFKENENVTLHAIPAPNSSFVGWTGDASGTSSSYSFVLDANKTINANFEMANPNAPSSVVPSGIAICDGSSATLVANGVDGTVNWYANSCDGPLVGTGNSITVSPSTTTTYYARNFKNGLLSATCAVSTVTVNPNPNVQVTASGPLTFCPGGSVTLTATGADSYSWGTQTGSSLVVSNTGSYTVAGTTNGCTSYSTITSVNVADALAPVPTLAALPTVNASCAVTVNPPTAMDNCKGLITGTTTDPTSYNTQGTFTINWVYNDGNGNVTNQTQTVIIKDETPPVIACAFNITVNADPGKCGAVVNYNAPSATDNCGNGSLPTSLPGYTYKGTMGGHTYFISNTQTTPEAAHSAAIALGGHLVTINSAAENTFVSGMNPNFIWIGYTDRDVEGTYRWVTNEPVVYTNWNAGEPNNCCGGPGEDWAVINWGPNGTWNDWFYTSAAYYVVEFEGGQIPTTMLNGLGSGAAFPIGTTIETWRAVDAAGNIATCSFTITVVDNQGPVPTVANLPVIKAECAVTVPAPTATDNCGVITATTTDATTFTSQGTYTINWKYNDGNGHVVNQVQTVIVKDITAPVVSCPSPISVSNDPGKCGAFVVVPAPAISDNCGVVCNTEGLDEYTTGNVTGKSPQWDVWPGGASASVTTEKYFSAPNSLKVAGFPAGGPVDQVFNLGNQTSGNWILTFKMYIPAGKTGYYNLQHTESLNSWAHQVKFNSNGTGVLDAVGPNVTFTYPQGQWFEVKQLIDQAADQTSLYINGAFIKSWQFSAHANGAALNNQLGAFNFFPVTSSNFMGAPEPNPSAQPLYYVDDITLCGDATQIGTYVSRRYSKVYNVGTTPAAIKISDLGGNTTTCSALTVTVADNEKPMIAAPAAVSVNADNGSCSATGVALGTPVTADNCGVASVTNDAPASFPVGTTTVTWTVTDVHNNSATSTQTVTVTDNQNPILTCTADKFFCYNGTTYSIATLGASDNCGIASITYDVTGATVRSGSGNNASGIFNVGTSTITWTVTDVNGNASNCSSTVTINPPVSVTIPDAAAYAAGVQNNTVYVGYAPAQSVTYTAQPTGGTAPYTYSWSNGATTQTVTLSPASVGVHNYTVTITDAKGCTATFTKSVTVVDVRCGNKNDKVLVCHKTGSASNPYVQICVSASAVATHLANGSYLGACTNNAITRTSKPATEATAKVLMAYPNPTQGNFNLQLKGFSAGKVTVQVLNSLGRTVLMKEVTVSYATQDETLNLKGAAAGIYQVRVVNADGVVTTAVVIAR